MKISASFLSSKNIPEDLTKLNNTDVDYIHVDIMDGKFVPNKTMPFREMKHIYEYTSKRLDVHLMVEDPSKYIPLYAELNTEYITIHSAISPDTKVNELIPYLPYLDYILVMSVYPGKGGQQFIENTENKLKEVRALLDSYNIKAVISVDGGIDNTTKDKCKEADILVSGSYIIKSDNFQEKISSLR